MPEPAKPREWTIGGTSVHGAPVVMSGPNLDPSEPDVRVIEAGHAEERHVERIAPVIEALSDKDRELGEALDLLQRIVRFVSVPANQLGQFEREITEPVRVLLKRHGRLADGP